MAKHEMVFGDRSRHLYFSFTAHLVFCNSRIFINLLLCFPVIKRFQAYGTASAPEFTLKMKCF